MNGKGWTHFPFVTYDGKRLYFASDRDTPGTEDIYYCDFQGDTWGKVIRLNKNINTEKHIEQSPSLTRDGKTLYFVRYTERNSYDIFYSTWQDTGWGPAVNPGPPVNTKGMEWSCCISPDGENLYFSGFHYIDSMSPPDICVSKRTDSGWSYPQLLFSDFDSNLGPDDAPGLSGDGQMLYFKRAFRVSEERDIYYSKLNGNSWGKPVNLGAPVNSSNAEMTPAISPDGKSIYFSYLNLDNEKKHPATARIYVSRLINAIPDMSWQIVIPNDPNPYYSQGIQFHCQQKIDKPQMQLINLKGIPVLIQTLESEGPQNTWIFNWNESDIAPNDLSCSLYICKLTNENNFNKLIKLLRLNQIKKH